jgi:Beta/Gamma crystallin
MRWPSRLSIISACAVLVACASLDAQRDRGVDRRVLTVYEDINFRGPSRTFQGDVSDLRASGFDGRVSSLRMDRDDYWEVCTGRNFSGRCQVFSGDQPDLRRGGWNDTISSMRRVRPPARVPAPLPPPPPSSTRSRGLELYAGLQYSGQRLVVREATPDLKRVNFNDRAMSVRVPDGESWEICVNAKYDDCRVIDHDMPDLGPIGLSRLVSSARPRPQNVRGRDTGDVRIVLFDRPNFAGNSMSVNRTVTTLTFFNDRAGSVQVYGGRWELCDKPNFGGHCAIVSQSVRDLATLGLRDRVSSIRAR